MIGTGASIDAGTGATLNGDPIEVSQWIKENLPSYRCTGIKLETGFAPNVPTNTVYLALKLGSYYSPNLCSQLRNGSQLTKR